MTITEENGIWTVGKDFVDCVTGKPVSHGEIELHGGRKFKILSMVGAGETSDALIIAARKEGVKIACIMTQNL